MVEDLKLTGSQVTRNGGAGLLDCYSQVCRSLRAFASHCWERVFAIDASKITVGGKMLFGEPHSNRRVQVLRSLRVASFVEDTLPTTAFNDRLLSSEKVRETLVLTAKLHCGTVRLGVCARHLTAILADTLGSLSTRLARGSSPSGAFCFFSTLVMVRFQFV